MDQNIDNDYKIGLQWRCVLIYGSQVEFLYKAWMTLVDFDLWIHF